MASEKTLTDVILKIQDLIDAAKEAEDAKGLYDLLTVDLAIVKRDLEEVRYEIINSSRDVMDE